MLEKIILEGVRPKIFTHETIPTSDVWDTKIALLTGKSYLVASSSGRGKSSLCSFLLGTRHDYLGTILFDNQDIRQLHEKAWTQLRQKQLSILWQDLRLFPMLTVSENIQLKNNITAWCNETQVNNWLERLGILHKRDTLVAHLSLGQQQRVALIRALCQPFSFLILDEPMSHLDFATAQCASEIVQEELQRQQAALIVTSVGIDWPTTYDYTLHL